MVHRNVQVVGATGPQSLSLLVQVNRYPLERKYHMPVYGIEIPTRNSLDALAEAREARDQLVRSRMSRPAYTQDLLAAIAIMLDDERTGLGEVARCLFEAPIRDEFDRRGYLHLHDGHRLGRQLLELIAEVSLEHYQQADTEGF
jgi:hypothetical protein